MESALYMMSLIKQQNLTPKASEKAPSTIVLIKCIDFDLLV